MKHNYRHKQPNLSSSYSTSTSSLSRPHSSPAFTIVELLIVIVVIAILATLSIVAYNGITGKAKESAAISSVEQIGKKVTVYALSNGVTLPATLATAGITNSGGTTYQYSINSSVNPNTFCLTATKDGTSAQIAGTSETIGKPTLGPCIGHTGTVPTTLAGGATCPTGYIVVPGSSLYSTDAFCVMKYEAKNDGSGNPVSTAAGTPWVSISQTSAISTIQSTLGSDYHLITEAEWMTIAQNVLSVASNWSNGAIGPPNYIYSGHNDNAPANALAADANDALGYSGETNTGGNQRRTLTLTNGNVIWDLAGNVWEWTSGTSTTGQPGASGYAWRQWNALSIPGSLQINASPAYANSSASSWTSSNGIGQLYSNSDETAVRGFLRGGTWNDGGYAGVVTLNLGSAPSDTYTSIGFRVSR